MTQTIITHKIVKYIETISAEYLASLDVVTDAVLIEEHKAYIEKLKKDLNPEIGYCFGFSLCHGAMDVIGKLQWWEEVLVTLYHWDELKTTLDEKITLNSSNKNAPTTRRELFELVMNAVLFNHAVSDKSYHDFMLDKLSQLNILKVNGLVTSLDHKQPSARQSYFEMLDESGNILTIKQRKVVAGTFTNELLDSLLATNLVKNAVCLISSGSHTIRVGYDGNQWMLYDPNYSHESVEAMHFCGDKKQVIDEICRRLETHSFAIEVASFNEKSVINLDVYYQTLKNSPEKILSDHGLRMIAQQTPELLADLFVRATGSAHREKMSKELIAASLVKNEHNWMLLHYMALFAPGSFHALFNLARDQKIGDKVRAMIAATLAEKTTENMTAFYMIARHAPVAMRDLLSLASHPVNGRDILHAIAVSLCITTDEKWTGLSVFVRYTPDVLPALLTLASHPVNGKELRLQIAAALLVKNNDDCTALHFMENHARAALPILFNLLLNSDESKELITVLVKAFLEGASGDSDIRDIIIQYSPPTFEMVVLEALQKGDDACLHTLQALGVKNASGQSAFELLNQYSPSVLQNILLALIEQIKHQSIEQLTAIMKYLKTQLREGQTSQLTGVASQAGLFQPVHPNLNLWQKLLRITLKANSSKQMQHNEHVVSVLSVH